MENGNGDALQNCDFMSLATLCSPLVIAGVLMEELIHLRAVL